MGMLVFITVRSTVNSSVAAILDQKATKLIHPEETKDIYGKDGNSNGYGRHGSTPRCHCVNLKAGLHIHHFILLTVETVYIHVM